MFYAANSFDNGQTLIQVLNTFWALWFSDQTGLKNLSDGNANLFFKSYIKLVEAFQSGAKATVPVHSLTDWRFLTLKESERLSADSLKNLYGQAGLVYGMTGINYADMAQSKYFSYPIPENIKANTHLYNRLLDPSFAMTAGIDFVIDGQNHLVHFYENPLTNPLIPVRSVLDGQGNVIDKEFALWSNNTEIDEQHIWVHFGYVLGIWMQSSEFYRQFISALWDNMVGGSSKMGLRLALSALTGIPFCGEAETVVDIQTAANWKRIMTDKNVYQFKSTVTPVVSIGDHLAVGDPLVDAVRIVEPSNTTNWSNLLALSLGQRFLGMDLRGPIYFENKTVNLEYLGKDAQDRAVVQFSVKGWPDDVQKFWDTVHLNGLNGTTLAHYVDTRVNRPTETGPGDIPPTINPFSFVMENLFRNNLYVIELKPNDFAAGAPGMRYISYIKDFTPPQTTFIIFVELDGFTDYYPTSSLSDTVDYKHALAPMNDLIEIDAYGGGMLNDAGVNFKLVPERCR